MIFPVSFRNSVFISVIGHITLFGMFSLSFGHKIPEVNFARVCFWGAILRSTDLMNNRNFDIGYEKRGFTPLETTGRQEKDKVSLTGFTGKSELSVVDKINRENLLASRGYLKPPVSLVFNQEKIVFQRETMPRALMTGRKESAIMFYPRFPYHFALYFKDRQTVHIELAFAVISGNKRNSILVRRRVSSGNLEADLLSMRYISRYLFMQQRGFAPNKWQIVKIDLSTANDK